MDSKFYQMGLDALTMILGSGTMGDRLAAMERLGVLPNNNGRFVFEVDGKEYVFYLVYNGSIPGIATPIGKDLPFPVLIRILKLTHGDKRFSNRVLKEYEQVHTRAIKALTEVRELHKDLQELKIGQSTDPVMGFFEDLMRNAAINNKLNDAIATVEKLAGVNQPQLVEPPNE
jgi:hypothetical protein